MIIQPTWLGQPVYPGGFPLNTEQVHAGDRSIRDIYYSAIESEGEYTTDEEETLKSYCIYYLGAPVFDNELTQDLKAEDLMSLRITDLIMKLLDVGLDPF